MARSRPSTSSARTWPTLSRTSRHVEHCLESAEFIVCNDIFPTEDHPLCGRHLPGRRLERGRRHLHQQRAPGATECARRWTRPAMAMPNWWVFKQIAKRMGQDWESNSGQELWDNEISELAPQFSRHQIQPHRKRRPAMARAQPGSPRHPLPAQGRLLHLPGLGNFTPVEWTPPAEVPDEEYPLVLSVPAAGSTTTTPAPRPAVAAGSTISSARGNRRHLHSRTPRPWAWPTARRCGSAPAGASVEVTARVTSRYPPGMVWMAFHFREACANWLTNPVYDPVSEHRRVQGLRCQNRKSGVGKKSKIRGKPFSFKKKRVSPVPPSPKTKWT